MQTYINVHLEDEETEIGVRSHATFEVVQIKAPGTEMKFFIDSHNLLAAESFAAEILSAVERVERGL